MSQALLFSDPVPSVSLHNGRPAVTSREVSHYFDKRHDQYCGIFAISCLTARKSLLPTILW